MQCGGAEGRQGEVAAPNKAQHPQATPMMVLDAVGPKPWGLGCTWTCSLYQHGQQLHGVAVQQLTVRADALTQHPLAVWLGWGGVEIAQVVWSHKWQMRRRCRPPNLALLFPHEPLLHHTASPAPSKPVFACSSQEGQYEREGYGQRPYDNWETIMFDCENQVGNSSGGEPEACTACIGLGSC